MRISVTLIAELKRFAPGPNEDFELDLEPGADADSVLQQLGIAGRGGKIVLINGRQARKGQLLSESDHLTVIPAVEGG